MSDALETPRFDEVVEFDFGEPTEFDRNDHSDPVALVVVHRNAEGVVYAYHSPLNDGIVDCTLCKTPGTRVYV